MKKTDDLKSAGGYNCSMNNNIYLRTYLTANPESIRYCFHLSFSDFPPIKSQNIFTFIYIKKINMFELNILKVDCDISYDNLDKIIKQH